MAPPPVPSAWRRLGILARHSPTGKTTGARCDGNHPAHSTSKVTGKSFAHPATSGLISPAFNEGSNSKQHLIPMIPLSQNSEKSSHEKEGSVTLPAAQTVPPPPPPMVCWVAREVYGFDNPRWLEFRAWMLGDAPQWLRGKYIQRGEGWAAWLAAHPRVKPMVRAAMEAILRTRRAK